MTTGKGNYHTNPYVNRIHNYFFIFFDGNKSSSNNMSKRNFNEKSIDVDTGELICVECAIIVLICFHVLNRYVLGIASLGYRSFIMIDVFLNLVSDLSFDFI